MRTIQEAKLVFCNACEKVTYISAIAYHYENPCYAARMGWDCMEFEAEEMFCGCEVSA
jgi:hypothetical protein